MALLAYTLAILNINMTVQKSKANVSLMPLDEGRELLG